MSDSLVLNFIIALAVVLGLLGVLAWAGRRFGMIPGVSRRGAGGRLRVVEVTAVDAKRRLLLIRRDTVEHLVLLGATGDLVVERGIGTVPVGADKGEGELPWLDE